MHQIVLLVRWRFLGYLNDYRGAVERASVHTRAKSRYHNQP